MRRVARPLAGVRPARPAVRVRAPAGPDALGKGAGVPAAVLVGGGPLAVGQPIPPGALKGLAARGDGPPLAIPLIQAPGPGVGVAGRGGQRAVAVAQAVQGVALEGTRKRGGQLHVRALSFSLFLRPCFFSLSRTHLIHRPVSVRQRGGGEGAGWRGKGAG